MEFYSGEERLYFAKLFLNDGELRQAFLDYIKQSKDAYEVFSYALANNFYAQIADDDYSYTDPNIKDSKALIEAVDSGKSVDEIYKEQIEQYKLYSEVTYSNSWNNLIDRGEALELPSSSFTVYETGGEDFYLYLSSWQKLTFLGSYNSLPEVGNYLDLLYYTGDNSYYLYNSGWMEVNSIETDTLPSSSYDFYKVVDKYYYYNSSSWVNFSYMGEVDILPQSPGNLYAYHLTTDDTYYLNVTTASRTYPDIPEPSVFLPVQVAVETATGLAASWHEASQAPFYKEALKSIKYGSIKHFFYRNRERFIPSYDLFLIDKNRRRKAFVNVMLKEFDKFSDVVESLREYNDPDYIPDKFLIYFMEILGFTVNDFDSSIDEAQARSLIKNLMEVYRRKGSTFAFEVFFGCMGIDCGVRELYFDRRLFYQNKENPYTRTTSKASFAYYLTPKNPSTTSYPFYLDGNKTLLTEPITSEEWNRLLEKADITTDEDILSMLGFISSENIGTLQHPFTYFKSNYLLFNFTSPYNKMKYGSEAYSTRSDSVTKTEFDAYVELLTYIIPVFIKQYYQNSFETTTGEDDIINYGTSRTNPMDLFLVDSNLYNDDIIRAKLEREGKRYLYPEISSADLRAHDYRVSRQIEKEGAQGSTPEETAELKEQAIKDLPEVYLYDVIGGTVRDEGNYLIRCTYQEEGVMLTDDFMAFDTPYGQLYKRKQRQEEEQDPIDLYPYPGEASVGILTTDTKEITDGVVTQNITQYFWKVNEVGETLYGVTEDTLVRILPALFFTETILTSQSQKDGVTEYLRHSLEPEIREESEVTFSENRGLLFEQTRWREPNHIGEITETEVEFEYYSYDNPLLKVEISYYGDNPPTVTLE